MQTLNPKPYSLLNLPNKIKGSNFSQGFKNPNLRDSGPQYTALNFGIWCTAVLAQKQQ